MADARLDTTPRYERLLAEKVDRLSELMKRKPGHKHYKSSLRAFLEADAKAQKALIERIEHDLEPRSFDASH